MSDSDCYGGIVLCAFVFVNRELGKERIQVQREGRSERERERGTKPCIKPNKRDGLVVFDISKRVKQWLADETDKPPQ